MSKAREVIRLRKPTFQNLVILLGGEIISRGFTFIAFAYLARTLGNTAYGFIAPAYAILMFATLIVDFGAGTLGTREIAKDPDQTKPLVNKVASSQLLLAIAVLGVIAVVCLVLPIHSTMAWLLIAFGISLLGIPFFLNWVFQGRNEMHYSAGPMALRQFVFLAVVLIFVSDPGDVTYLPIAEISGIAVAGSLYVLVYKRLIGKIRLTWKDAFDGNLLKQAFPIGGAQFIWALRVYLPVVAVGIFHGTNAAGLFDVGHRIVMVFLTCLGVYFTNLFPALSLTSKDSLIEMKQLLYRSLWLSVAGAAALSLIVSFTAPIILRLVYGGSFVAEDSVISFVILAWLVPVLALRRTGRTALIALDRQNLDLMISVAGAVIMILLLLPLTYFFGIIGCAWSMVISELISAVITWVFLLPKLRQARA